jgi:membrane protease YdiL (CAAX protease family)
MQTLRELRAISLLVLRSWFRMGPRVRGGRKPEPSRGFTAVLMRLVFAALIYNFGFTLSIRLAAHPAPAGPATWSALGVGLFAFSVALGLELPTPRAAAQPLKSELLEMLPLSRASKLLLILAQAFLALLFSVGLVVSTERATAPEVSLLAALSLATTLFAAFAVAGACLGRLLRQWLSAYRASRLSWLATVAMLLGLLLLQLAPTRALLPTPPFGLALGQALLGSNVWRMAGRFALATLLLAGCFFWLERRQELAEPVRPDAVPSAFGARGDMPMLERVLTRREPGGRFQGLFAVGFHGAYVIALTQLLREHLPSAHVFWNIVVVMTLQLVSQLGMQRATRGATRDLLARPLLGGLPIAPRDTLAAKASTLRRSLLAIAAPLLLSLAAGYWQRGWLPELLWRSVFSLLAVAVYASTATYIAFLTTGLGSTRPRGGAFGSLESFLVIIPFASVLFAPDPASALLSLATLAALTFEARRAALGTIEWLDDPEREHATEVWKALVVFGGFQGAQALTQQLAGLFESVSASLRMLGAYALAALALWLMTRREQTLDRPQQRARWAPLGLLAGALSGALAWLYLRLLQPTAPATASLELHGGWELVLTGLAVVAVAPLVEERFFRGWLQPALERSLGARRYWAPVLTALAFAAAHPAYSFLPVLVLGLLNGLLMLRTRSLTACVVAHAVHNACALWLASTAHAS